MDRKAAEVQRRKRGIAPVKGTTIACEQCGVQFVRSGIKRKFCAPCADEVMHQRARDRVNRLARERGAPQFGEELNCKHCGTTFKRSSPRECYCEKCKELQKRSALPLLKEAVRKYKKEVWLPKYWEDPEVRNRTLQSYKKSRNKRKADPAFTINERISVGIRQSLARGKGGARWQALVDYTLADLMRHLERQFLPGMTWENRGAWHLDHIQPLASFNFTTPSDPDFKAAWSLPNLRPLWACDNLRKSAQRTHLL